VPGRRGLRSEYRYRDPIVSANTLVGRDHAVGRDRRHASPGSRSEEEGRPRASRSATSSAGMATAGDRGHRVPHAGPEIGVASTRGRSRRSSWRCTCSRCTSADPRARCPRTRRVRTCRRSRSCRMLLEADAEVRAQTEGDRQAGSISAATSCISDAG
jgi:hypothetical protein